MEGKYYQFCIIIGKVFLSRRLRRFGNPYSFVFGQRLRFRYPPELITRAGHFSVVLRRFKQTLTFDTFSTR